ncbi:hypothetical protein EJ04DRAFT_1780 [Polyplosphaeria fusca]|uniref:Uncharacterized protein n=1 Tax=Polyplosphaeria fusca TaxID=682080 RepID=A0A9P4V629_9PLEO|nr:hypothetical protein EJ04DRAFT_1780 [Polyplosphaeria fusca]
MFPLGIASLVWVSRLTKAPQLHCFGQSHSASPRVYSQLFPPSYSKNRAASFEYVRESNEPPSSERGLRIHSIPQQ